MIFRSVVRRFGFVCRFGFAIRNSLTLGFVIRENKSKKSLGMC